MDVRARAGLELHLHLRVSGDVLAFGLALGQALKQSLDGLDLLLDARVR